MVNSTYHLRKRDWTTLDKQWCSGNIPLCWVVFWILSNHLVALWAEANLEVTNASQLKADNSSIHITHPSKTDLLYEETEEKPVNWINKCKSVRSPHLSELLGTKYGHFFCHCIIGSSPKVEYILSVLLEKKLNHSICFY